MTFMRILPETGSLCPKFFFTLKYLILQGLEGRYRTFMIPAGVRYAVNPLASSLNHRHLLPPNT